MPSSRRTGSGSTISDEAQEYLRMLAEKEPEMNKYGLLAREHWTKYAPARTAALEDATAFFEDLGNQVAAEVRATSARLERTVPRDLPYLERAAQLKAVQKQAEEIALHDLVFSLEPELEPESELRETLSALPTALSLETRLEELWARLHQEMEQEAEDEALTVGVAWEGISIDDWKAGMTYPPNWDMVRLSAEDEAEIARVETLLPLVRPPHPGEPTFSMSRAEIAARIAALRPFLDEPL